MNYRVKQAILSIIWFLPSLIGLCFQNLLDKYFGFIMTWSIIGIFIFGLTIFLLEIENERSVKNE